LPEAAALRIQPGKLSVFEISFRQCIGRGRTLSFALEQWQAARVAELAFPKFVLSLLAVYLISRLLKAVV